MEKYSLAKDKIKILLLEGLHQSAVKTFTDQGYTNIEYLKTSLPEDQLSPFCRYSLPDPVNRAGTGRGEQTDGDWLFLYWY